MLDPTLQNRFCKLVEIEVDEHRKQFSRELSNINSLM